MSHFVLNAPRLVFKNPNSAAIQRWKKSDNVFSRLDAIPACDKHTERQTENREWINIPGSEEIKKESIAFRLSIP